MLVGVSDLALARGRQAEALMCERQQGLMRHVVGSRVDNGLNVPARGETALFRLLRLIHAQKRLAVRELDFGLVDLEFHGFWKQFDEFLKVIKSCLKMVGGALVIAEMT